MRLKWSIVIILIVSSIAPAGCTSASPDNSASSFTQELSAIAVPPMDATLLDSSEADQLRWLASIYQFELDTLRAKTSELTKDDITLVQRHLSQVYGSDEIKQLIDGF